jgi:WD40 repeat protein/serine/threonine protein kinase
MVGEFVLRERIDEGGFGAVYRCEQPLLGREAVVKVLHQRLRRNDVVLQRFMREAQLASRLDHPYAAHIYAFGIEHDDGLFWIAMEMVQGTTLNRWLRERGPLRLEQFVPFFGRVAEVVQTAHDRGIVHRDLKPSNVMVIERAGQLLPKLLDFGVAKLLDDTVPPAALSASRPQPLGDELPEGTGRPGRRLNSAEVTTLTGTAAPPQRASQQHLTHADATVGSPPYMSPEQWSNAVTVGPASDLYALAVVAFEALTGRRPFNAATVSEYVDLHCNAAVPALGDGFSPALDRVFQRALAKRPGDRWSSALELSAALRAASGLGSAAPDLPKLDESVRDSWLARAPQPLAESIAALDGARNVHQARDAALELVGTLLRYLLALALATRAQVREDRADPALLDLVRSMRRRELRIDERIRLLRLLVRPLAGRRGAHPLPELVDLGTPRADDGADGFDAILSVHAISDRPAAEDIVRMQLARLVPELSHLLRKTEFVLDYELVVPRNGAAERWTGLRRHHRALATVTSGELVKFHAMLLDHDGRICVDLWPLVQAVSPTEGAAPELFLFDGRGRHGARLIAAPAGLEHHDPSVWEWLAARVIAEVDVNTEVPGAEHPPYLGLTPFSTSDAARFVGREAEVDAFLNRLRQRALQIVVGPSGAGKSSFVHAGVIPGLPSTWRTITMRPGSTPLATLAARLAASNITTADLRPVLETSPAAIAALVTHAAASGTIVLVIDQLEELFTLCTSASERLQFAAVIAQLAASVEAPIRVIGAIRDDFLMQLDALSPLRPLLSPALVLLGNPSREALVRIIVEPARRVGYVLSDPELAHDMVSAVALRPGALALLSFTALRLWELRDRRFYQLTRKAYDAMGGIGGALGRHAEAMLERFSADEQRLVRLTFRHLVTADGTRALLTIDELRQRLASPSADPVIDKLVATRLITVSESDGESHVEIIHDALIEAWPRLRQWIREDVDGARMRDEIRISARQWHGRDRSRGLLWRDDVLADLERWMRRSSSIALSELEEAFVEESRRHALRTSRVRRALLAIGGGIVLLFALFQYRALQGRVGEQDAELRVRDVQSRFAGQLVTQSYVERGWAALLSGKNTEALIFLAEGFRRGDESPGVRFALGRAAQPFLAERARLTATSGRMWSATFSPDGKRIVTTDDRSARVWDAETHQLLFTLVHDNTVFDASYSPDGTRIITGSADGFVKIWNAGSGKLEGSLTEGEGDNRPRYNRAVMSPRGTLIAAIHAAGTVAHVWNPDTGGLVAKLPNTSGANPSLAFSADGRWLATSGGGDVRVFDTRTWRRVLQIAGPQVNSVSFDPTGPRLAAATWLGDVSIWSIPNGTRVFHRETGERVNHIAYSPDGMFIIAASRDGTTPIWNARTGELRTNLRNHRDSVSWAEFAPTAMLVVSAGADGLVAISDIATGAVSTFEGSGDAIMVARFDPSSRGVVAASKDGSARVWNTTAPYQRWSTLPISEDCGSNVSLEEDGRFVALSCKHHGVYVWDTWLHKLLAELAVAPPGTTGASSVHPAISADGHRVAIATGNTVAIYEVPGGRQLHTVQHADVVTTVAFARTGLDLASAAADGSLLVTRDDGASAALPVLPGGIDVVGFTSDGRVVAAGSQDKLRAYDPQRKTVLAEIDLPMRVRAFRMSSDGGRLLTIANTIQSTPPILWDLKDYRKIALLDGHKGAVFSARFVRDGREILTAGVDGAARLWDGTTGARRTYLGGSGFLFDAALDPEGLLLVTAGGDGVLRFWDVVSRRLIWTLRAHRSAINALHFEGSELVTRSFSGQIAAWSVTARPSPQEIRQVIDRITPCLPQRLDGDTGLVEQPSCVPQARGPGL